MNALKVETRILSVAAEKTARHVAIMFEYKVLGLHTSFIYVGAYIADITFLQVTIGTEDENLHFCMKWD